MADASSDRRRSTGQRIALAVSVLCIALAVALPTLVALGENHRAAWDACGITHPYEDSPASRYNSWKARWSWTEPGWTCMYFDQNGDVAETTSIGMFP